MSLLLSNYKNELYKLLVKKKYFIFLAIGMLICSGKVFVNWLISLVSKGEVVLNVSNLAMSNFGFICEVLVPLVVFMAVTDLFSTEMHDLTIKAILMRPISRTKIMISKALAVFTLVIIYFATTFVVSMILELIFGNPARMSTYIGQSALAYIIDLIPMAVLILMAILINMINQSTTLSMFLCVIVYACMKYFNYFVTSIGNMLFTSYMQWHKIWIGYTLPFGALMSKIGLIVGTGIIFFTVSYLLFDKKEF